MLKIRLKNLQTAQGMVEFALVLPVLLMLILGIFAFGHLFFTYSSVTSASREAARWGAAVGAAPSSFPRYRDCASIRASAVRVGAFAQVNATDIDPHVADDTGVAIGYDNGPTTTPYASCPEGDLGPENVKMGDRIIIRTRVNYRPIVPFLNLPSFPLEATTFRTILRSVPVGEVPTSEDPCMTNTSIEAFAIPEPSVVGQAVTYGVRVKTDDGTSKPTGEITLYDHEGAPALPYVCSHTLVASDNGNWICTSPATYWTAGNKTVTARFDSDNSCQISSITTPDLIHEVKQSPTIVSLAVNPWIGHINESLTVTVSVQAAAPGAGTPTGWVIVDFPGFGARRVDLSSSGIGLVTFAPLSNPGTFTISVQYPEEADENYEASGNTINVDVYAATPTLLLTPTYTVPPPTPTKTPVPIYCPRIEPSNYDIFQFGSAIQVPILNPAVGGAVNQNVTSVEIYWPREPEARLQEIRFGGSVNSCTTTGNPGGRNCLWRDTAGLYPSPQTVTNTTSGWDNSYAGLNVSVSKFMHLVFNHALPTGPYLLVIRFSGQNCVLEIERYKN